MLFVLLALTMIMMMMMMMNRLCQVAPRLKDYLQLNYTTLSCSRILRHSCCAETSLANTTRLETIGN